MKKKIFLVLFAAIAGTNVLFAEGTLIDDLYYNLNTSKKTATVRKIFFISTSHILYYII